MAKPMIGTGGKPLFGAGGKPMLGESDCECCGCDCETDGPTAEFSWAFDDDCLIDFTDDSVAGACGAIVSWSWVYASSVFSTSQNPTAVDLAGDGPWDVTLTVTDAEGCTDDIMHTVPVCDHIPGCVGMPAHIKLDLSGFLSAVYNYISTPTSPFNAAGNAPVTDPDGRYVCDQSANEIRFAAYDYTPANDSYEIPLVVSGGGFYTYELNGISLLRLGYEAVSDFPAAGFTINQVTDPVPTRPDDADIFVQIDAQCDDGAATVDIFVSIRSAGTTDGDGIQSDRWMVWTLAYALGAGDKFKDAGPISLTPFTQTYSDFLSLPFAHRVALDYPHTGCTNPSGASNPTSLPACTLTPNG